MQDAVPDRNTAFLLDAMDRIREWRFDVPFSPAILGSGVEPTRENLEKYFTQM